MKFFQYIPKFWIFGCMIFFGSSCIFTIHNLSQIPAGNETLKRKGTSIQGFVQKDNKPIVIIEYSAKKSDNLFGREDSGKLCFEIPDQTSNSQIHLKISEGKPCEEILKIEENSDILVRKGILNIGNRYLYEIPERSRLFDCTCEGFPLEKKISYLLAEDREKTFYGQQDRFLVVFQDGSAFLSGTQSGKITKLEFEKYLGSADNFNTSGPVSSLKYGIYYPKELNIEQDIGVVSLYLDEGVSAERDEKKKTYASHYFPWTKSGYKHRFLSVSVDYEIEQYKGRAKPEKILLTPFTIVADILTSPIQILYLTMWGLIALSAGK